MAATLTARSLAVELSESTERMPSLVAAVKTYAYVDRGGVVDVDLHEGLEMTLVVLGHNLKRTSIQVVRDYDRKLPRMTVFGSELNEGVGGPTCSTMRSTRWATRAPGGFGAGPHGVHRAAPAGGPS